MPQIKPFRALLPAEQLLSLVVTRPLENYSAGEAKLLTSENEYTFLHLINPELDNLYLRGARQELIYKKISENLEGFLEHEVLVRQKKPALYVYRTKHNGLEQTGIWTLTHISDYLEGRIKKHETTVEIRERLLADYLQQTGLDANPVLITYWPDEVVDSILEKYVARACDLDLNFSDGSEHQIWIVSDDPDVEALVTAFGNIPYVYIADGHHRVASMVKMGLEKKALNIDKHNGTEGYNYFTTVYMNSEEVNVMEFNRLVKDLGGLSQDSLINTLKETFTIHESKFPVKPAELHQIGMYFNKQWYVLEPKNGLFNENDPVEVLDVSILQNFILGPVLKIKNPRTDSRIAFAGGRTPVTELQQMVDSGTFVLAFTLFPISVKQIIAVANARGVMPPKSTWVEPKFPVGLLTNQFT